MERSNFSYTNQRDYSYIGLQDYKARWYSPSLGRFTQPDLIVPDPGNPQAWNRYSYVLNSPLMYIDPSGHVPCEMLPGACGIEDDPATSAYCDLMPEECTNTLDINDYIDNSTSDIDPNSKPVCLDGLTCVPDLVDVGILLKGAAGISFTVKDGNLIISGTLDARGAVGFTPKTNRIGLGNPNLFLRQGPLNMALNSIKCNSQDKL